MEDSGWHCSQEGVWRLGQQFGVGIRVGLAGRDK
jgi:hypothetical protein